MQSFYEVSSRPMAYRGKLTKSEVLYFSFSITVIFLGDLLFLFPFSSNLFALATAYLIMFQPPSQLLLERCLVFYQSTEVNVCDDMLELWFTQDAEHYLSSMCLFYGSCVMFTISALFLLFTL